MHTRVNKACVLMSSSLSFHNEIGPTTPLRLKVAATLAFPDGSMTASGLRREAARGRLVIERIAGKDFTTIANIDRMRELCRASVRAQDSTNDRPKEKAAVSSPTRSGQFETENEKLPQESLRATLKESRQK